MLAAMQFHAAPPAQPKTTIRIRVRLFAQYGELAGTDVATVELPSDGTVADAVAAVRAQAANGSLIPQRPLAAVNLTHVLPDHRLADGDELALFPPLAGG